MLTARGVLDYYGSLSAVSVREHRDGKERNSSAIYTMHSFKVVRNGAR